MSAIFGIVRHDGGPVSELALGSMQEAMGYWGPDGGATWLGNGVGLGHLLLRITPESDQEVLPLYSDTDGLTITAAARLDNRDELFDALGTPQPERRGIPDGRLILESYRKWGRGCVEKLLGDWSFALWDRRDRSLFLARDHFGNTGLYYHLGPRFTAFASSFKGLLALTEVPRRPDALTIGKVLVSCPLHGEATCYEGIFRLPPAHVATIASGRITVNRYWRMEDAPELRLGSDAEYVDAFLEVYSEAVRCRLRTHRSIGLSLSGGLDSSSVAALAAPELEKNGRRLLGFCHVPSHDIEGLSGPGRFGDETPFVELTRGHLANLDVKYLSADEISPIAGVRRGLAVHDEPQFRAGNYFWVTAILGAAQRDGVGVLLTGQGGNYTISWAGDPVTTLLPLLAAGRLPTLWRELNHWRRLRGRSLIGAIRGALVRPLIPVGWVRGYKRLRSGGEPWREYSAINRRLAKSLDLETELARCGHDPTFTRMDTAPRTRQMHPLLSAGALWNEAGAAYALEVRDPTWDKRVISFCLGTPVDQFAREGRDRLLVRRAMHGLLPAEVVWNPRRGLQAADVAERVLERHEEMEEAFGELESSDLAREYLNLARLKTLRQDLERRLDRRVTAQVRATLLRGLTVGLFLSRFDAGSASPARGAP